jgi:hypothetical protein
MINQKEKDLIEQEIDRMVSRLTEMGCDSVSVLTTMRIDAATDTLCTFGGNYYARIGVMQDWLNHERDVEIVGAVADNGDDDESWKEE